MPLSLLYRKWKNPNLSILSSYGAVSDITIFVALLWSFCNLSCDKEIMPVYNTLSEVLLVMCTYRRRESEAFLHPICQEYVMK